jgi:chromosome segregation protein
MLTALELVGFKSFADRTLFEFPQGISVVVGPNGSGKSNLVDAIKWVLGSQSAKSLRGHEMVDVIFNGSASRGPLGTAEATLSFNNANGRLAIDAREVHVTRRVYRSGESEYLINRQPCRLRDVRELLAGTGITTEAYCIIEQGKVDALLQSSPRERRVIFEEAAGISQFKSKKTAALRRMERVEQNLLRLSDIVEEVESRVRSVRAQASKARKYRDCAGRLQELRTHVGLFDWRTLSEKVAAKDRQFTALKTEQGQRQQQIESIEAQIEQFEQLNEESTSQRRAVEAKAAETREQIAAGQALLDSHNVRQHDLQQEIARYRRQLAAMNSRAGASAGQLRELEAEYQAAERELGAIRAEMEERVDAAGLSRAALDGARKAFDDCRQERERSSRLAVELAKKLSDLRSKQAAMEAMCKRFVDDGGKLESEHQTRLMEWQQLSQGGIELQRQLESRKANLESEDRKLARLRSDQARCDKQHRQFEQDLARLRERINVLHELEERLDGLDGGVQQLLKMAHESSADEFGEIFGVVADIFHVDIDTAPLVEVALGEKAQFVVLSSTSALWSRLERGPLGLPGRVGFLSSDHRPAVTALDRVDLSGEPGVMGRADQFVETAPRFGGLASRLLGRTWLVDRLSTAVRLSRAAGRGLDFVTSDGELLQADGTLIVGRRPALIGILSRRSELRACTTQASEIERKLAEQSERHGQFEVEATRQDAIVLAARATLSQLTAELTAREKEVAESRGKVERLEHEIERIGGEASAAKGALNAIVAESSALEEDHRSLETMIRELDLQSKKCEEEVREAESAWIAIQAEVTERQVASGRAEERLELLRHQWQQAARHQMEKDRATEEACQRLALREAQLDELEETILVGRQELASLFLEKEEQQAELDRLAAAVAEIRRRRGELGEQLRVMRQQFSVLQAQRQKVEVAADRLRHERKTLCDRMRDDYGIDLATAATAEEQAPEFPGELADHQGQSHINSKDLPDREAIELEITQLRSQLTAIGAVNIDALEELEQIESRFNHLSQQHRDLVDAKAALERIIQKINVDSRQLFVDTVNTVREHFQDIFRRLFGGGEADIVLDDQEDVLESGIEIMVKPPGKEACSITLLSGGEKTLTCVALLLAVFRSKPSPFCVLDEVDAALDEANIGRFVAVLRDFLSFTQFIIVTHSKKTMAGADTLYGVTMEESGVSKRVSVRFEEVGENGQIQVRPRRAA